MKRSKAATDVITEEICNVPFIGSLLNENFNISESILDAYYRLVPQPDNDVVLANYSGPSKHFNPPFRVSIYGAFPLMKYWENLECNMEIVDHPSGYYKNFKREAVFTSLKKYAKGFQYGFDNFLTSKINSPTSLSNSEDTKVQKVKDFLSSPFNEPGFSENFGYGDDPFIRWYEDGIESGKFYCAWYMVLENHHLFEGYFRKSVSDYQNIIPEESLKLTIPTIALLHVYLSMAGGQPVTQNNKKELAVKYGHNSGEALRNAFMEFEKEEKRLDINTLNKRSATTHLERYKRIFPLLEKLNMESYNKATADFKILEREFRKHHNP